MAGRRTNSTAAVKRSKRSKTNPLKRSLDALAIASKANPDRPRIRQHRLGEAEGPKKARRPEIDEVDTDDMTGVIPRPKSSVEGRFDELDIDEGSDSEGNEWRLGHVGSGEDSEIDSDEAMGSSDEEKFEGFTFRGSSSGNATGSGQNGQRRTSQSASKEGRDIDLNESDDMSGNGSEDIDDDLGEEAVDLAAMLEELDEGVPASRKRKALADGDADNASDGIEDFTSDDSDESDSLSVSGDEESPDPAKISALQNLISSLQPSIQEPAAKRPRLNEENESRIPSEFGLASSQKLTVADLLPSVTNSDLKKSLKNLSFENGAKASIKRNGIPSKLEVPLAKRQQDRLDRIAAYEKSKETLNRWIDTVKHNRRADHLSFPLPQPSGDPTKGARQLLPTSSSQPLTELESAIRNILQESGLVTSTGETDEDKIRSFEELQTNKMPLAEVQARRAQLRMARELLFREEVRAKRIKKIKSKAYRRVHRKQREKTEREAKVALLQAGIEMSDEGDLNDRRRAEERMGARHRESKWAKAAKSTGKAAWDEDARSGILEIARRGEELKRRIEGKEIRQSDGDDSDLVDDETSEDDNDSEATGEEGSEDQKSRGRLLRRLERAEESSRAGGQEPPSISRLSSMKFMAKAEAARKAKNDVVAENLRRELAGEGISSNEEQDSLVGRKRYGLTNRSQNLREDYTNSCTINVFEEGDRSDEDEAEAELDVIVDTNGRSKPPSSTNQRQRAQLSRESETSNSNGIRPTPNPWLDITSRRSHHNATERDGREQSTNNMINSKIKESQMASRTTEITPDDVIIDPNLALKTVPSQEKSAVKRSHAPPNSDKWKSVALDTQASDGSDDENEALPAFMKDHELMKRAFAGDDVVEEFEKEKRMTILDEEEKIVDNTLPGWGNWTGSGISKKEQKRNRGKVLSRQEGIKEENRKDAKLDRVIVNERRVKKNVKYLASTLPHPFETREQYERSLRLPVGPEWTTKDTFQNVTKPRVVIKQGRVIDPMSNPFL